MDPLKRYSVISFVLLVILCIALSFILGSQVAKEIQNIFVEETASQAKSILEPNLLSTDFTQPLTSTRFEQIDTLLHQTILTHEHNLRVNIWNLDGLIIYSNESELVNQSFPITQEFKQALEGKTLAEVYSLEDQKKISDEVLPQQMYGVYAPIRAAGSSQIIGVLEIHHDMTDVNLHINRMRQLIWIVIGTGFLVLYVLLFSTFRNASTDLVNSTDEKTLLLKKVETNLEELDKSDANLQKNFQFQTALSELLRISLLIIPLEEQLQKILEHILSIQWLSIESRGCIFLVKDDPKVLELVAQKGLNPNLLIKCAHLPFGKCLCGRAAKSKELQFAASLDDRHEIQYEGISSHGHYSIPILSEDKVLGVLNLYLPSGHAREKKEEEFLFSATNVIANIIKRKRLDTDLEKTVEKLRNSLGGSINSMVMLAETRDPYTAGHQKRVADLARAIADEMKLPKEKVENLRMASTIHDIGKISIPAEILSKPSRLNDLEFNLIKGHPQVGFDILIKNFPSPIPEIILQHHERMDGSGYPLGIKGNDILIEARILAVADVVEAMTNHRPYRPALGIDKALEEINKNKGIFYDPQVVDTCMRLFKESRFHFKYDKWSIHLK